MNPYDENIVTYRTLLDGYEQALRRFTDASKSRNASQVFLPLFEALNWAVALDDQARAHWAPEGVPLDWSWRSRVAGGDLVNAVRCARNRVHHQWADALIRRDGMSAPLTPPLVLHEWTWRPLNDLPKAGGRRTQVIIEAESDYERALAAVPARITLTGLLDPFRRLADMLEPPRPR
ncbi:hypothetical protein EXE59_14495 [Nocardioides eburneiflavus]|uniref:pEK499-p136 HEPN domain-containing protein n=1 Tax=Nocardioides eburneiflavus TaxID=2518372 RepID=A0A4Z1CKU4_9ACTN|nr:hypothetical protein [Nocardioides eburneiflavus]TGN65040.1 hypothetical protein EXE59_14495 [Nocardioides eburneiflavus]